MTDIIVAQAIGTLGCSFTAGIKALNSFNRIQQKNQRKMAISNPRSGGMMSLSIMTIPSLALPDRHPPGATVPAHEVAGTPIPHLTHQFAYVYDRGKGIYPPLAVVASLANGYLAWVLRDTPSPTRSPTGQSWTSFYVTSIVITLGIVPWTLTVMKRTNDRLRAHAARDDAALAEGTEGMVLSEAERARREKEDDEVPGLLWNWARLNICRSLFPLTGAVIGFCGVVWMK